MYPELCSDRGGADAGAGGGLTGPPPFLLTLHLRFPLFPLWDSDTED